MTQTSIFSFEAYSFAQCGRRHPTPLLRHVGWQLTCEISLPTLMTFQHSPVSPSCPPAHVHDISDPGHSKRTKWANKVKDIFSAPVPEPEPDPARQPRLNPDPISRNVPIAPLPRAWPYLALIKCPQPPAQCPRRWRVCSSAGAAPELHLFLGLAAVTFEPEVCVSIRGKWGKWRAFPEAWLVGCWR